jgi:hypothetical protein
MASLIPKHVKKEITDVWVAETWKLMLLSSVHVPNASTQQFVSDVSANQITDAGGIYTAGGVSIGGGATPKTSVADGNNYFLDAPDKVIGTGASLNYRYGILFQDTGNPATSKIRAQIDFVTDQIVVNGTSTIKWNALGIIYVS